MALRLYADDVMVYDSRLQNYKLLSLETTEGINKSGTVTFTMPPNHPAYNRFVSHRTVVELYENEALRFRGRALFPSDDWIGCRTITCEGERGFLRDGIIRPYLYQDTPAAIFAAALALYNAEVDDFKRFTLGTVTVTDPNDYVRIESESAMTFAAFFDKLVERCGGYITFNNDGKGGRAINWLAEIGTKSQQAIEFGENLLDFARSGETTDLATAIVPYGAQLEEGGRVTIESVTPDGADWIMDEQASTLRGIIKATVTWDDVTQPANLLAKAQQWLAEHKMAITSLELTAADLSKMDRNIGSYHVGDMVRVVSKPHNVNEYFQLAERTTDWLDPAGTKVGLGKASTSLVGLDVAGDRQSASDLDKVKQQATTDLKEFAGKLNALENKVDGIDGTYFYIKYSQYADGRNMTDAPNDTTQYMGTCSTNQATAPTDPKLYTWVKVKGADGQPGTSQYLHIRYSDDGKTFTGNMLPTNIDAWESGYYTTGKVSQAYAITSPKIPVTAGVKYRIMGRAGYKLGVTQYTGENGETFKTAAQGAYTSESNATYATGVTYIRVYYVSTDTAATFETFRAAFESGELVPYMYPAEGERGKTQGAWMGTCASDSETAPTDFNAYTWSKTVGTDGTPGEPGENGKTQYLHIKYSDDGETFTANNGEELGAYIGTLVDFNEADSTNFGDYTWKKFTEDVDEELDSIKQTIEERYTSAVNTAEEIILSALVSYVETGNYEEFKKEVETQLEIMAGEISMNFSTTTEQITNVDGDLQTKFTQLYKFIKFSGETAITIGSDSSAITLEIDNEKGIIFKKGGVQFGLWDGENFYTGNIMVQVNERAQFGNFAFVPRSDGSLMFLKVGG